MKHILAIQLQFDIKTVRKAVVMLTGEMLTDEEIAARYFDREMVITDVGELMDPGESFQMCLAFLAMMEGAAKAPTVTKTSAFQERLKKALEDRKNQ